MPISLCCRIDGSWIAQNIFQQIKEVASENSTVHICGEIGTGKHFVASMIHSLSDRNRYPLFAIDCTVIHERRMSSNAVLHERRMCSKYMEGKDRPDTKTERIVRSVFRQAGHGTLILDDINRMELDMQEKMLQVIKETANSAGEERRAHVPYPRIIMITHRSPQTLLGNGTIKFELYNHLHPVQINLKALRDCKKNIPVLANYYYNHYNNYPGNQVLPESIIQQLLDYDWPGNLYELQNTIQRYLAYGEISFLQVKANHDEVRTS